VFAMPADSTSSSIASASRLAACVLRHEPSAKRTCSMSLGGSRKLGRWYGAYANSAMFAAPVAWTRSNVLFLVTNDSR